MWACDGNEDIVKEIIWTVVELDVIAEMTNAAMHALGAPPVTWIL
jgi:hypothetical protein